VKQIPKADAIILCHVCLVSGPRFCDAQSNYLFIKDSFLSYFNMCSNLHVHKLEIVYTTTSSTSGCSASFLKTLLEGITIEGGSCDSGGSKLAADFLAA
jgi:hypothetical protein